MVKVAVPNVPVLSTEWTVMAAVVPGDVEVSLEITPAAEIFIPVGSDPTTEKVGEVPVEVNVPILALATVAVVADNVGTVSVNGVRILIVKVVVPVIWVPAVESVTLTVMLGVPTVVVASTEITPFEAMYTPVGSDPTTATV
jgi:hypothetical protein